MTMLSMVASLMISAVFAQTQPSSAAKTPAEHADKQTERMVRELGLDQKQAAEVGSINDRYGKELLALKQEELPKEEMKPKRRAILERRDGELQNVLTKEQWTKLVELRKEWKEDKKEEHQEKHGEQHEKR